MGVSPQDIGPRTTVHLLNRAAFGPRPGDIDRVLAEGLTRWIEEHLDPKSAKLIRAVHSENQLEEVLVDVTINFRDAFQEVARAQFGITDSLFPGYSPGAGLGIVA